MSSHAEQLRQAHNAGYIAAINYLEEEISGYEDVVPVKALYQLINAATEALSNQPEVRSSEANDAK